MASVQVGFLQPDPRRFITTSRSLTSLSVDVALLIGSVELLQVLSTELSLEGGFWDWLNNLDFGHIGYAIVTRVRGHLGIFDRRVEEGAHRGALGQHGRGRVSATGVRCSRAAG